MFPFSASTDRANAFPELSEQDLHWLQTAKATLTKCSLLKGKFTFSLEAREWYKSWYEDVHRKSQPRDRRLAGFHGRKHDHVSRVGMLMAGSFQQQEILVGDLEAALMAVEDVETAAMGAFQEIGATVASQHYGRFKAFMRSYKRIAYSLLLKLMYPCTAQEFKVLLETAILSGMVTRDDTDPKMLLWLGD